MVKDFPGLLLNELNKEMVREYCEMLCVPDIFDSFEIDSNGKCIGNFKKGFKVKQAYIDGKNKAEEMFKEIISSPKRTKEIVELYSNFIQDRRIDELESEIASLKADRKKRKCKLK